MPVIGPVKENDLKEAFEVCVARHSSTVIC